MSIGAARPGVEDARVSSVADVRAAIARLRDAATRFPGPPRAADAIAEVMAQWRRREFSDRRDALLRIANATGFSRPLLDESIDALLAPFSRDALHGFASRVVAHQRVGAFIMPANVPGAGIHELVTTLISGSAAMVKPSQREPFFFPAFAHALSRTDSAIGALVELTTFGRDRDDLTAAFLKESDFVVALGEDATLAHFDDCTRLFGFGSRASGALVSLATPANVPAIAKAIARDITLFEQQGCLSPHHVFVEDRSGTEARAFGRALAGALDETAARLPPAKLTFHTAAAIRRVRETARWRKIGSHQVDLWEGAAMSWTVMYDPSARFTVSPGFRTICVTPIRDRADFESRLAPVAGLLEAFAISAAPHERGGYLDMLARAGVSYVCDPGQMQSPQLLWPHGGGAFLDFICGAE